MAEPLLKVTLNNIQTNKNQLPLAVTSTSFTHNFQLLPHVKQ